MQPADVRAILKVGPWLTFVLREALYGLDLISGEMTGKSGLKAGMEALMQPEHWQHYYPGDTVEQRLQRHYSYPDRIRYYWAMRRRASFSEHFCL
ncbi:class II D-tagatose-bisphosphate aldolase non-catalytic subunit [Devosia neptuniae]|uniref:class II D-tagatose-bisphosphate aldolase non-catalytic subunit n=1 Tax=Devosia neptuniae TaxID=191302 RepID=UPI0029057794|nr:class II D-tagatose-bisphosphate aldolase, non-catalytic subunit [Devosia neptuniae]